MLHENKNIEENMLLVIIVFLIYKAETTKINKGLLKIN